jgi:small-conductance mechanosensitive channel
MNIEQLINQVRTEWGIAGSIGLLTATLILAFFIHRFLFKALERWSYKSEMSLGHLLYKHLYYPTRYFMLVLAVVSISPLLGISINHILGHVLSILLIASVAALFIRAIAFGRDVLIKYYDLQAVDNLTARKVYTQFKIIERIAVFLIVLFAIGIALMTFNEIRQIGVSLLASAGIVGIIVGFAAQKSLGTILAGIQIAIAQPIRIEDAVVVEGEFGRVEEITLTYVVLKLWDQRRLIVPINYFLDKPFQNWTRVNTELIGSVFLFADYTAPIDVLREEFNRILSETPLWDKRVAALQVTNASDRSIEIRMIMSAANSGEAFDLRCLVREKMIGFIQKNYPHSLPRTRTDMDFLPQQTFAKVGPASTSSIQQPDGPVPFPKEQ